MEETIGSVGSAVAATVPKSTEGSENRPKTGSKSIREAILRIGCRPVDNARAEEVRNQLGLDRDTEITHYDSLAAGGWAKAEGSQSKDWALFLRDTAGENPTQLAKLGGAGSAVGIGAPELLRQEDFSTLSDEALRQLLARLEEDA